MDDALYMSYVRQLPGWTVKIDFARSTLTVKYSLTTKYTGVSLPSIVISYDRSSHPVLFCQKAVLKKFVTFTGKHLQWIPIFNKFTYLPLQLYKKQDPIAVFFSQLCKIFQNSYSI